MKLSKPQKLKSGIYVIHLRLNDKCVPVYGDTEAECRRNATAIKANHLTGKVRVNKCTTAVSEAIDKYIENRQKLSPSTIRGYKSIQKNLFPSVMEQKLDDVDWQQAIDKDDHAPKTIHNAWGFIASVLAENNLAVPRVRLPAKISNERAFLQPNQLPIFLKAINGTECELAALLGLHSLRRSEILDVTYGDVDLKRNIIHVRGAAVMNKDNEVVHKKQNKNASSTRDVPHSGHNLRRPPPQLHRRRLQPPLPPVSHRSQVLWEGIRREVLARERRLLRPVLQGHGAGAAAARALTGQARPLPLQSAAACRKIAI